METENVCKIFLVPDLPTNVWVKLNKKVWYQADGSLEFQISSLQDPLGIQFANPISGRFFSYQRIHFCPKSQQDVTYEAISYLKDWQHMAWPSELNPRPQLRRHRANKWTLRTE